MRKRWLALLLGLAPFSVWAQCQPTNSPTLTQAHQYLLPSQMSTAAVTMNFSATDGTNKSHAITVGVGTTISINWQSYNVAPLTGGSDSGLVLTYALDNGQQGGPWYIPASTSGTVNYTFAAQYGWAGHVGHFRMTAKEKPGSGSFTPTTQDVVTVTVTSQAPGIYYSDGSDTNVYVMVSGIYSGTPNIPYQTTCTQAAEKDMAPTAQLQVFNLSSGESRNGVTFNGATTVVGQPVYATAYDYVSALPGDTITGTFQGITYCTAIGNIFSHLQWFRIEYAETIVKDLGHLPRVGPDGGSEYDVAPICQNNCDPPDWPVNLVDSFSGRHTYWIATTTCLRAPDVDGVPWVCAADYMYDIEGTISELGVLEAVVRGVAVPYPGGSSSAFPIPGKCTKYPVNVILTVGPGDIARFFQTGSLN